MPEAMRDVDEIEAEYARQALEERLQWEKEFIASEIKEGKTNEQARDSLAERIKRLRTEDELYEMHRPQFIEWCLAHGWTDAQAQRAHDERRRMDRVMSVLESSPPYAATVKHLDLYLSVVASSPVERDRLALILIPYFDYRVAPDGLRTEPVGPILFGPKMPGFLIENPARTLLRRRS